MSTLRWIDAVSALQEEIFQSQFTSPLVVVPEAGPGWSQGSEFITICMPGSYPGAP
jgi:hypothetical protein